MKQVHRSSDGIEDKPSDDKGFYGGMNEEDTRCTVLNLDTLLDTVVDPLTDSNGLDRYHVRSGINKPELSGIQKSAERYFKFGDPKKKKVFKDKKDKSEQVTKVWSVRQSLLWRYMIVKQSIPDDSKKICTTPSSIRSSAPSAPNTQTTAIKDFNLKKMTKDKPAHRKVELWGLD